MLKANVDRFVVAGVIGLERTSSIPLLSYDLFINVLLTTLFLWPLMRSKHSSARLRRVAFRTLLYVPVSVSVSVFRADHFFRAEHLR